ncbi:hypothetical protein BDV93DRAFT_560014 [Ceratobasidium sp. AG-I]|nr:hypothetical protein BDV93DRAFT_560014 [Ceratobasidium sp. AG-I]
MPDLPAKSTQPAPEKKPGRSSQPPKGSGKARRGGAQKKGQEPPEARGPAPASASTKPATVNSQPPADVSQASKTAEAKVKDTVGPSKSKSRKGGKQTAQLSPDGPSNASKSKQTAKQPTVPKENAPPNDPPNEKRGAVSTTTTAGTKDVAGSKDPQTKTDVDNPPPASHRNKRNSKFKRKKSAPQIVPLAASQHNARSTSNEASGAEQMTEADTSSSYSDSVPTPTNPHISLPSTSHNRGPVSRNKNGPKWMTPAPVAHKQTKKKPSIEQISLECWAERPPDEDIWSTDPDGSTALFAPPPQAPSPFNPPANIRSGNRPHIIHPLPPRHVATMSNRSSPAPRQQTSSAPPASPAPPAPIQPPVEDSPTSMRRIGLAYVLLGPGACVQHVFTDAESPWIMISGLPRQTRKCDVQSLVAPFGETRYMKLYEPKSDTHYLPTARVLFERHEQAQAAVKSLHSQTIRGKRIGVRLITDVSGGGLDGSFVRGLTDGPSSVDTQAQGQSSLIGNDPAAIVRSCTVKATWYAPSASVYVTYASPKFALDRVKELNGRTFGNRRVRMQTVFSERDNMAKVGKENGGFVVRVDGLWANLDLDPLSKFVRSRDIVVQPNYSSEAGLTKLREDLSDIAPLESFKLLPNRRDDLKYHALAQYTTPTAAAAAVKVFEGRRGEYLANSPVWVTRHLTIRYSISAKLVEALQGEINKLHSWAMDDPDLHVRQQEDNRKPGYVQLTLSGNSTKQVAAAKAQLDRALAGEPLQDREGLKIWDQYFMSEDGIKLLESVAAKTSVCLRADQRTNSLLLFGPAYAREDASELLRAELTRLAQLKRILSIPRPVFRRLAGGGLTILRNLVGNGNIWVNVFRESLTFYGNDQVVRRVKKAIDVMYSEVGNRLQRHSDCVVCLCQPEGSILLHCGHHYCKTCFSQYVASAAESRTLPLVCVGNGCKANIPLSMITLHASLPDQDALFHTAFQAHVAAHPDQYRYCPTPDCQYIYRVGPTDAAVQCRLCLTHICTHCHVEQHEGISCEDYLASHDQSEIQKSFDRWRAANDVKPCPNCKASIEKIAGCNHMMCSACRTHMCWVCVKSFPTGDEVYDHMRKKHGGIGL